jgi:hypothetical protein
MEIVEENQTVSHTDGLDPLVLAIRSNIVSTYLIITMFNVDRIR